MSSYSRLAFGEPVPIHPFQGDLFHMTPWGPARMDQGGYPPESNPGYDPKAWPGTQAERWLFWNRQEAP